MNPKTWRLADLSAKHALLLEGIGCGNMPLPMIEPDLVTGSLVRLAMPDHTGGTYRFSGIWRRATPPGPAASWLLDRFCRAGPERQGPGWLRRHLEPVHRLRADHVDGPRRAGFVDELARREDRIGRGER